MGPRIARGCLPEPQALIEIDRSADVCGGNAELVKSSRHEGLRRQKLGRSTARRARWPDIKAGIDPALDVLADQIREEADMPGACVQRRHILELAAPRLHEALAIFHGDFLEGLEAIDRKSRARHRDTVS